MIVPLDLQGLITAIDLESGDCGVTAHRARFAHASRRFSIMAACPGTAAGY